VRGHSQSDVASIFNVDDRVHDYQDYPKAALQSLAAAGWNGGRDAANWTQPYRDVQALWNPAPSSILVGFARYGTADGGALGAQSPCGDGDAMVGPGEWIEVASRLVGVDEPGAGDPDRPAPGPVVRLMSAQPARDGRFAARVTWPDAAMRGRLDLVEVRGRVIVTLFEGVVAGVYCVRAIADGATAPAAARIVVTR
jgi:hypothetical protein